jgi:hypothetical protein
LASATRSSRARRTAISSRPKACAHSPSSFEKEVETGRLGGLALRREAEELGALVGGIGIALGVAEGGEVVDDLPYRLLGQARE